MKNPRIRIVKGERYIPITINEAIEYQNANIMIYQIDNLKSIFVKECDLN